MNTVWKIFLSMSCSGGLLILALLLGKRCRKNTKAPTLIEFIIDPDEMVYPMIRPGGTLEDMIMDC